MEICHICLRLLIDLERLIKSCQSIEIAGVVVLLEELIGWCCCRVGRRPVHHLLKTTPKVQGCYGYHINTNVQYRVVQIYSIGQTLIDRAPALQESIMYSSLVLIPWLTINYQTRI